MAGQTGARFDVSLVSSGHDVADARLHRLCGAFVDAGLAVELMGLGRMADAPAGLAALATRRRGGLVDRALQAALLPWAARGRVIVVVDPDTVPSAWLRRLAGRGPVRPCALVVDVHEDYAALLHDRSWARRAGGRVGRVATVVVRTATALARLADITVVADDHVPPLTAAHRRVVRNLPSGGYLPAPSARNGEPRALHVGDLRRSRGLFTMLAALEAAPGWTFDLVGPVAAADAPDLTRWQATSAAASRLRLHGRLPPAAAWSLAAGAWAGLALLDDTPAFRDAVPTKVYEYLASGLPVVCTPLPRMAALVTGSGAGAVVATSAQAADVLNSWSRAPASCDAARQAAQEWAAASLGAESPYAALAAKVAALARDLA